MKIIFSFFQQNTNIINEECVHGSRTSITEFQPEKFNIGFIPRTKPLKDPNSLIKLMMLVTYFCLFGLGSNAGFLM